MKAIYLRISKDIIYEVQAAADELVALLKKYFGDGLDIEVGTVTREHPRFDFFV